MAGLLQGRVAVLTGANQGLGLAIAKAYAQEGASLLLCARGAELLEQARVEVSQVAGSGQVVDTCVADVSDPKAVQGLYEQAMARFPQVHILVNNAGVYGPAGRSDEVDWEEWTRAIQINLYGSVLPSRAFVTHFRARGYGKIVQLSGGGATNPLPRLSAYAASKAAIVRFAETLAEELRSEHIDVNAIAPGALNTRMLEQVLEAGPEKVGSAFYERALKQKAEGGAPLERGAALAVFLGSSQSDGITGKLLSAVWDPWETLPEHREELLKDIYTLRRIVPKDRGMPWGDR